MIIPLIIILKILILEILNKLNKGTIIINALTNSIICIKLINIINIY